MTVIVDASSPILAERKYRRDQRIPINSDVIVVPTTFAKVNGVELYREFKNFKRIE